jgi:hypothetical protein
MRNALLATTGLVWLALTGAAGAVTVTLTPGPQDPQYFAAIPVGQSNFSVGTDSWSLVSGTASTEQGSLTGQYAQPLGMVGTTYMSVFGGGTEQVVFGTAKTSLSIYWGSIDPGNSFSVTIDGYTLTGADLAALYGAHDDGSHTSPLSNQLVTISGLGAFTTATFSSNQNSFEFSLGASAIPEPSTWAMMGLGFAALGYAAFRRNSKSRALAI